MTNVNLLDELLFLYNNLTVLIDLENRQIEALYDSNSLLKENISFQEFVRFFADSKDFDYEGEQKMFRFISNLKPSSEPFEITANYKTKSGENTLLNVKGLKYDNKHILLIISDTKSKQVESYDSLTKVYTRNVMLQKIKNAINDNEQFVLMIIDIDNFKTFNETYGHMFGDIVLVETAASIKKYLGNKGFVGRLGGDEFIVLAYVENDYDVIHTACRDVRFAITNVSNHNIKQAQITATVGCVSFPKDADDFDELFKKANKALCRGKKKGRNCFIIYDEQKCSNITDDDLESFTSFDQTYQISNSSNIVAGIFEILNRGGDTIKNIDDSLTLIGNYFLLDRIVLITLNPDNNRTSGQTTEWINPRKPENKNLVSLNKDRIATWRRSLDKTGMLKYVQVDSNQENKELYEVLKKQNTTAILAFELIYMDKLLGLIRYDMCSTNRFWQQSDVSSLMLISKIFSIYLNKENDTKKYKKQLFYDRLTDIYNFSKWRDEVYIYLANSEKFVKYSLIYFNVENFMNLNDTYGIKHCDNALVAIANGLKKIYTDKAIFCRVNGDNFLIFIPHQNIEFIDSSFKELKDFVNNEIGAEDRFILSGGVYLHDKLDKLTTAIDKANLARKQSKTSGSLTYFSLDMFEAGKKRAELEMHMHKALQNDEFLLYLQPKINTQTGEVVGAEALTRWNYKNNHILTPNHFIPLFEENGFIKELDFKVFENVCKFQRKCLNEGLKPIKISVNVSRYQNDFDNYIDTINSIRSKYRIPSELIEIELTEGMYIENISQIADFITKLHSHGYKISMDDFGSGYSNLSSLATLDFDLIKLDKNFCANQENEKENIILSFVMSLAKQLKMDVLCEGVETQDFADYLKKIGCTLIQGFLFERPIPSEEFKSKYLSKKLNN